MRLKMKNPQQSRRECFLECNWKYNYEDCYYGYHSVMSHLVQSSKEMTIQDRNEQSEILQLLARAASMRLEPSSINDPFKPDLNDRQEKYTTTFPKYFSKSELILFEMIINDIHEPLLKSRISDLLWLLLKPRNVEHAKLAIKSYTSLLIDAKTWHPDVSKCWERAVRLCIQIRDYEQLNKIKSILFTSFSLEHTTDYSMDLRIAELLDKLNIDSDFITEIVSSLQKRAITLQEKGYFHAAISYFRFLSKKHKQSNDDAEWLKSLISIAKCFELEGNSRVGNSNMAANSFYEKAIQAYRKIPTKYRNEYFIEEEIKRVRVKITETGQASIAEMCTVHTPMVDISDIIKTSIEHVTGKRNTEEALMYFTGLYPGANYEKIKKSALNILKSNPFSSLFGSTQMSTDGRVIAKTQAMKLNMDGDILFNKSALYRQIQLQYSTEVSLVVDGGILPALRQLLMEHRFSKEYIVNICQHSMLVPQGREKSLGYALWLGFECEFGTAIHLLCPQMENIIRTALKGAGAHTSNIDSEGIEHENGLSTLMELPEAAQLFGENLTFEIKSIFTNTIGPNLRNEVAHGLLDDDSSSSIYSIYAWWMILKLVMHDLSIVE